MQALAQPINRRQTPPGLKYGRQAGQIQGLAQRVAKHGESRQIPELAGHDRR
jgi:hypothetical protein